VTETGRRIVEVVTADGSGLDNAVVIYHAQEMVSVQDGCSMDAALALLQNTADATDTTLADVAEEVVAGRVTFHPPS